MAAEMGLAANTIAAYRRDLIRYLGALAQRGLSKPSAIAPQHVSELLHILRERRLSPATIARNITSIKRFHAFLLTHGQTSIDPTANLDPPKLERKLPEFLTVAEVERLMEAIDSTDPLGLRDRAILELLYASGMRASEVTNVTIANLMLDQRLLQVPGSGRRMRQVPIGGHAVGHVGRYLRDARPHLARPDSGDSLFLNAQGGSLSRMSVWKIIRAAADRASLGKEISPHTLRHSFATHLLEGGAHLGDVQELLGHADISTTQVYAQVDRRDLREVHRTYHPRG